MRVVQRVVVPLALAAGILVAGGDWAAAQDKKAKDGRPPPSKKDEAKDTKGTATGVATFELYKDSADEFRFRLRDGEGTLLATSGKGYKTKADCQRVIEAIRSAAARAKLEDETTAAK
jgi:uncharacterized protein YegP (UPF0339 family)